MDETELQKAKALLDKLQENSDMENLLVAELFKQLRTAMERIATNNSSIPTWKTPTDFWKTFGDLQETEQDE